MRGMVPAIEVMSLTVHGSGRQIIDILRRNPEKDPDNYEEEDIAHMRKAASHCKVRNRFRINYSFQFPFKVITSVCMRRCLPCVVQHHGSIHGGKYKAKLRQTFIDYVQ